MSTYSRGRSLSEPREGPQSGRNLEAGCRTPAGKIHFTTMRLRRRCLLQPRGEVQLQLFGCPGGLTHHGPSGRLPLHSQPAPTLGPSRHTHTCHHVVDKLLSAKTTHTTIPPPSRRKHVTTSNRAGKIGRASVPAQNTFMPTVRPRTLLTMGRRTHRPWFCTLIGEPIPLSAPTCRRTRLHFVNLRCRLGASSHSDAILAPQEPFHHSDPIQEKVLPTHSGASALRTSRNPFRQPTQRPSKHATARNGGRSALRSPLSPTAATPGLSPAFRERAVPPPPHANTRAAPAEAVSASWDAASPAECAVAAANKEACANSASPNSSLPRASCQTTRSWDRPDALMIDDTKLSVTTRPNQNL